MTFARRVRLMLELLLPAQITRTPPPFFPRRASRVANGCGWAVKSFVRQCRQWMAFLFYPGHALPVHCPWLADGDAPCFTVA